MQEQSEMDSLRGRVIREVLDVFDEIRPKTLIHTDRRTGLTTSVLYAIGVLSDFNSASIMLVCRNEHIINDLSNTLGNISQQGSSQTEICSFYNVQRQIQQPGGLRKHYDLIIVDDYDFFDLRKELSKNTKRLILCQTSPRKLESAKNKHVR
jgi:hypothetical protein